MTGAEKRGADFAAIVTKVLATVLESMEPPPVIRREDVDVMAAELVKRVMAFYPPPYPGMTNMIVTPEGEAFGFVEGSVDNHL